VINLRLAFMTLALSAAVYAHTAAACGDSPIFTMTKEDGTKIGLVISESDLAGVQQWTPGKGEPPLSVSKAIDIALKWGKTEYTRFDELRIQGIDINSSSCGRGQGTWYYLISFTPVIDGNALFGSGYFVAVLMNGKVVAPRKLQDGS